ncbi:MAG: prolipoprotein diacylglyceryl transferase [Nitrospiraceae bacterium]|nr:prolipoprotein diacylglyceryl transferase [Nitrospiraceae bacterium]
MIPYPRISPYLFKLGPFEVRWYGLMYVLGFITSYLLFSYQAKRGKGKTAGFTQKLVEDFYFWLVVALVLGARIGYVIFYNPLYYLQNPLKVFAVWQGGMSFHGGLIGVVLAGIIFCRKHKLDFWRTADLFVPTAPPGLGFGRIGNFINGELFGRPSNVPWAMVFPQGGNVPRHPSQIYEFLLEGVLLFTILWILKDRVKTKGLMLAIFLILYGLFRFTVEFFRQPDPQLGFIWGPFTMGQILSSGMMLLGVILAVWRVRAARKETAA